MVEHEICLLTWALSHIGHVNNIGRNGELIYIAQEPLDNTLVLNNLSEYRHKWYIAKTRFLDYISVADSMSASATLTLLVPKATELGEITKNKGQYAIQGHCRSLILVLIETIRGIPT